jgi:hypothetical protein
VHVGFPPRRKPVTFASFLNWLPVAALLTQWSCVALL